MKHIKILSTVFTAATLLVVSCSNNDDNSAPIQNDYLSIPDAHFETILIEQGIDTDGVVNKKMLRSDAESVSRLNLNISTTAGEISNLTGVEGFTNITYLSAVMHNITEVDLSLNTKIDTLYLTGNNIKNIDISANSNLIFFDIQSNLLTSITGLEQATHLKDLDLSSNFLESINIPNASLEILHMSNNDLKSININQAINLQHILLTTNLLTTIDISANTLLETLLISDNHLTALNLENNSKLSHLYVSSNNFTSFDVSNNLELIDLRIDRNPELTCIKIDEVQNIPTTYVANYQELNTNCE